MEIGHRPEGMKDGIADLRPYTVRKTDTIPDTRQRSLCTIPDTRQRSLCICKVLPETGFSGVMPTMSGVILNHFRSGQIPDLKLTPDNR